MSARKRTTRRRRRAPPAQGDRRAQWRVVASVGALVAVVILCALCVRSCVGCRGRHEPAAQATATPTALVAAAPATEPPFHMPTIEQFAASPRLRNVRVVMAAAGSGEPASGGPLDVVAGTAVRLYVLLQCAKPGDPSVNVYFSQAPEAVWAKTRVPADRIRPWPSDEYGPLNIRWYKVEPENERYSNGQGSNFAWAKIGYVETRVAEWDNQWSVPADVRPLHLPERLPGYGTMRYSVTVLQGNPDYGESVSLASAGAKDAGPYGISASVPRLSVRRDDSYVGWLFAWGNVPFVYGSESPGRAHLHQAGLRVGADSADLCVAAARKFTGKDLPYTDTYGLAGATYTRTLYREAYPDTAAVYIAQGKPLRWGDGGVQAGDMLAYGDHVAVLVEDAGTPGLLDRADVVFHCRDRAPELTTAGEAWPEQKVDVLRWRFAGGA